MLNHLLRELLGDIVHLDQQQLKLDVLNGHLLLTNLDVQPRALQRGLGLPLIVKSGIIGRIEAWIPWHKLSSEPTRLLMDRIYLLVVPQSSWCWDEEAEERRLHVTVTASRQTHVRADSIHVTHDA